MKNNLLYYIVFLFFWLPCQAALSSSNVGLIISNKDYQNTESVRFANRDAEAVKGVFRDVFSVPERSITTYNNLTKTDLEFLLGSSSDIGELSRFVKGKDTNLFIYYVGHGSKEFDPLVQRNKPYLLGVDSRPSNLKRTGYGLVSLIERLKKFRQQYLPQGHIYLLLESCFSGRTHVGLLQKERHGTNADANFRSNLQNASGLTIFSASRADQVAVWNMKSQHGIFTQALVTGLYGEADEKNFGGNGDKKISLSELEKFLVKRVSLRVEKSQSGFVQTPQIHSRNKDTIITVLGKHSQPYLEATREKQRERIESGQVLASGDEKQVHAYLKNCLYCPRAKELQTFLREKRERVAFCKVEKDLVRKLSISGSIKRIKTFKSICRCCPNMMLLEERLSRLQGPTKEQILDDRLWNKAVSKGNIEGFINYRSNCDTCRYIDQAKHKINDICKRQLSRTEALWQQAARIGLVRQYITRCQQIQGICGACSHINEAQERFIEFENTGLSESSETTAYRSAIAKNTSKAYYQFLKQFPRGHFSGIVLQKMKTAHEEESLWEAAMQQNNLKLFKFYKEKYPSGQFLAEAERHIQRHRDENAWRKALLEKTSRGFQNYLIRYPDGLYARQARQRLAR